MSFNGDLYPTAGASKVITSKGDLVRGNASGDRERYGIGSSNQVLTVSSGTIAWEVAGHVTQSRALEVACSDETTALTTGSAKVTFRMPFAMVLDAGEDGLRASLTTAGSTSGTTTIDVHMNGTTIMSTTKLTIDYGDLTSVGATTEPVITTTGLTDNAEMTIDIDGLTGGANEAGLKIQLIGTLT